MGFRRRGDSGDGKKGGPEVVLREKMKEFIRVSQDRPAIILVHHRIMDSYPSPESKLVAHRNYLVLIMAS